ncbi:MAG: DUF362 domain-containing protein [Victivallaceae bacterium]|nr:DUF362 domain-containing protein [Victivallaceae bacterium]
MTDSKLHKVFFAKCRSYADAELDAAVSEILADFDFSGKKVMIKPNWLSYRFDGDPSSVNPRLLCAIARYARAHGASRISVRENPGTQQIDTICNAMGISNELDELGVDVAPFRRYEVRESATDSNFRRIELASEHRDYDVVLNLARAKTHCMMTITLAVKNLFGMVRSVERIAWHMAIGRDYRRFADMLLDIYLSVRPQINIVDAVVCMEGNGPGNGTQKEGGFIVAGDDALAVDSVLCDRIFRIPEELSPVMQQARRRNLVPRTECVGELPDAVDLELPPVSEDETPFDRHLPRFVQDFLRRRLLNYPVMDKSKCLGCGLCARMCPPKSLKMKDGRPKFDLDTCIRCYCCQEHCPAGAITAKRPLLLKIGAVLEKLFH